MNSKPADIDLDSNDRTSGQAITQNDLQQDRRLPASRYVLFFFPAIAGLIADLVTKSQLFHHYFDPERSAAGFPQWAHWWVEGIFGIQTATNPGALFGMGQKYNWLFPIVAIVALVSILLWLFVFKAAQDRWLAVTLGMITGGVLGNLYDRLGLGYVAGWPESIRTDVRDWILFRLEGVPFFDPWPNFNIADCLLVCGAISLLFHAFFLADPPPEATSQED